MSLRSSHKEERTQVLIPLIPFTISTNVEQQTKHWETVVPWPCHFRPFTKPTETLEEPVVAYYTVREKQDELSPGTPNPRPDVYIF